MPFTEKPPQQVPPEVPRYYATITQAQLKSGQDILVEVRPTRLQIEYENRFRQYLLRLIAAIP